MFFPNMYIKACVLHFVLRHHVAIGAWGILRILCIADVESYSCEYGSGKYYALCGFGGILSCGITHTAVVPLDLVKCRIQVDPGKYGGIINGFRVTLREAGIRGLGKGWAPTFFGYSAQGLGKFGFYEVFKHIYADILGEVCTVFCYVLALYINTMFFSSH